MNPYETFNVGPYCVEIYQDEDVHESPADWESALKIVTTRNRYFEQNPKQLPESKDELKELERTYWVFPLYMYVHSGVALSLGSSSYPFNCPWDSGQVGFVLVPKPHAHKAAEKSWRYSKAAHKAAQSYVDTWNMYLSGDIWGYVITVESKDLDADLEEDENETLDVDSCWGFYGLEYCKQEAREAAEYHWKREREESAKIKAVMHV